MTGRIESSNKAPFLTLFHDFTSVYPDKAPNCAKTVTLGPMTLEEWGKNLNRLQLGCRWNRHERVPFKPGKKAVAKAWDWRERWTCDHAGIKRDQKRTDVPPEKRRKTGPSIKVGCKASLSVMKKQGEDAVLVHWTWLHTGHDPMNINSIQESRLLESVKVWIQDRVAEGRDWRSIHDLLRLDPEMLESLNRQSEKIPAALRVCRMDIYNVLRKALVTSSRLHPAFIPSLRCWAKKIVDQGGWAYVEENMQDINTNTATGWTMGFASKWQKQTMHQFGTSIACLDSTHNTCTGISVKESVYLYTIVVRSHITGQGSPVAFLLTNMASAPPLTTFLREIKKDLSFKPEYIIIDCSETEAHSIIQALTNVTKIIYCHWHFLKSIVAASKQKIHGSRSKELSRSQRAEETFELRQEAVKGIKQMMYETNEQEYHRLWEAYQVTWQTEKVWLTYVQKQWQRNVSRWAQAWRNTAHQNINTNNYIERWHEELKHRYLGTLRKQRADYLVHLLITKVLPSFQQHEKAVELGLRPRRYDKHELAAKFLAEHLTTEEQLSKIRDTDDGQLQVQSFQNKDLWYSIHVMGADDLRLCQSCTCLQFQRTGSPCKHIWTVFFALGILFHNVKKEVVTCREQRNPHPLVLEIEEQHYRTEKEEQLKECIAVVQRLSKVFAKAETNIGCFQAKHLSDLKAQLVALHFTAVGHYTGESPYATQQ